MLLRGTAIYTYIIVHHKYAGGMVCCQVCMHLKDVLEHLQTEWHMQEMDLP